MRPEGRHIAFADLVKELKRASGKDHADPEDQTCDQRMYAKGAGESTHVGGSRAPGNTEDIKATDTDGHSSETCSENL